MQTTSPDCMEISIIKTRRRNGDCEGVGPIVSNPLARRSLGFVAVLLIWALFHFEGPAEWVWGGLGVGLACVACERFLTVVCLVLIGFLIAFLTSA